MAQPTEWRFDIQRDLAGEVCVALYELSEHEQWALIDLERFGPFDTATDVLQWEVRHWAPRARLPLR